MAIFKSTKKICRQKKTVKRYLHDYNHLFFSFCRAVFFFIEKKNLLALTKFENFLNTRLQP